MQHPVFAGHALLLAAQAFGTVCFALSAVLFSFESDDCENELLLWLGPACALGAFARLNYVLFPSLYTDWLYTGDLLRTGFYVLLLLGAAREIQKYWVAQADLAVLDDRRRLARELHDGVIQELSFIRSQASVMPGEPIGWQQIIRASERGLEEARAAVVALGAQGDEPLSLVLARATRQLGDQYGVEVELELDDGVVVNDPDERHALVRIAREAVTNAVKHGAAQHIRVVLGNGPAGHHLVVHDDGIGFDVEALAAQNGTSGGYGLVSMRDRARGLAGRLDIESEPGAGSQVRVTW
jgi:signal transduction histidine kinase